MTKEELIALEPNTLIYNVTALQFTIYFNKEGDHDHNGLIFTLEDNVPLLKYIRALAMVGPQNTPDDPEYKPENWYKKAAARAKEIQVPLPLRPEDARQPHPLVRPLVLRARKGDTVEVHLCNEIRDRWIGPHLVGDGYAVETNDGSHVGQNCHSLTPPGEDRTYTWVCNNEGAFPFHDGGNYSGGEDGTNVHGLFGALIVEPPGSIWRDPVTGRRSHVNGEFRQLDGLYLDVLPPGKQGEDILTSDSTLEKHTWPIPCPYPNFSEEAHREFVIFFHDEPEFLPPHGHLETSPCEEGVWQRT